MCLFYVATREPFTHNACPLARSPNDFNETPFFTVRFAQSDNFNARGLLKVSAGQGASKERDGRRLLHT